MALHAPAPWHRGSFERFLHEWLPDLLGARLPLASYRVEPSGPSACTVRITVASPDGDVAIDCADVPCCDDEGLFHLNGIPVVVVPVASSEELETATIRCAGEQLRDHVAEQLGEAPENLPWDEALARAWLPVDAWVRDFLVTAPTAQRLDDTNWLSRRTHLRRLLTSLDHDLAGRVMFTPGHFGRVCPFESPEGPNIGRVHSIALGAAIRDGRLVVEDGRPEAAIGLSAAMVPMLEHTDANRALMGVNMMRQQLIPPEPEPALVQTGNEPDEPGVWCGRNLLTAFVSWGGDTFEDGIVVSESAARKLDFPDPLEPGDKLATRHGTKGVVARILPDAAMPHLPDGTAVELCFSFIAHHTRLNFGQVREAVMGRIARVQGQPVIVPPFHAPDDAKLRGQLADAGLPESGMETLLAGRGGEPLERPSTAGYVYWGKLFHRAAPKLHTWRSGQGQRQGEMEYYALRDAGAFGFLAETFNTVDVRREDAASLPERLAEGAAPAAEPPTPTFGELRGRLAAAGVQATLVNGRLEFRAVCPGPALELAVPVEHPWLSGEKLDAVGTDVDIREFHALAEADTRVRRLLDSKAPESLVQKAAAQLAKEAAAFLDALVAPEHLRLGNRVAFSGRAVIAPGPDLEIDQVGIPDAMAWDLFGPLAARDVGPDAVADRTDEASRALDTAMAANWVVVNRAPTLVPTSVLAFRPVRLPERVVRIHPLVCALMNADFDGDQIAVVLPVTEAGQRGAEERLSVAGHLARDPGLVTWLCAAHEMVWGLAELSRRPGGLVEVSELAGIGVQAPDGIVTRASLEAAMGRLLARDGIPALLAALERLMRRGFEVAKASGASISPFPRHGADMPPLPDTDEPEVWMAHGEEVIDRVTAMADLDSPNLGPQLLAVRSGARGSAQQLAWLLGSRGVVIDARNRPIVPVRHGLCQGLSPEEALVCSVGARKGLARTTLECTRVGYRVRESSLAPGFHVLSRAMQARRPGAVLARAAASGEVDPLTELDARLFVGLPPLG